ncbi:ThiF family adenylyltransferase [Nonomuraea sp. NPDC049309]|uniref:ThiF family adenylyltransferase n=1 Tax=Nonomuraea sp. NPDC049309 TaxID=3364350 RepID=UPI00371B83ED
MKPALRHLSRNETTVQFGTHPLRAVMLSGLSERVRKWIASLDGTRDLQAVLRDAARAGLDEPRARCLLDHLTGQGVLHDASAAPGCLSELPLAQRDRLRPDLDALDLASNAPDGMITTFERRRKARVRVYGAGRVGAQIVALLAAAGVGTIRVLDPDPARPCDLTPGGLTWDEVGLPREAGAVAVARRLTAGDPPPPSRFQARDLVRPAPSPAVPTVPARFPQDSVVKWGGITPSIAHKAAQAMAGRPAPRPAGGTAQRPGGGAAPHEARERSPQRATTRNAQEPTGRRAQGPGGGTPQTANSGTAQKPDSERAKDPNRTGTGKAGGERRASERAARRATDPAGTRRTTGPAGTAGTVEAAGTAGATQETRTAGEAGATQKARAVGGAGATQKARAVGGAGATQKTRTVGGAGGRQETRAVEAVGVPRVSAYERELGEDACRPTVNVLAGGPYLGDRTERPDLVILAPVTPLDGVLVNELIDYDIPHLLVSAFEGHGAVGPLVLPGLTACVHCLDLARRDRDPDWGMVTAQLGGYPPGEIACDVAMAGVVAAGAVGHALAFLDGRTPAVTNGTLEVTPDWQWIRRSWAIHPQCRCMRNKQYSLRMVMAPNRD